MLFLYDQEDTLVWETLCVFEQMRRGARSLTWRRSSTAQPHRRSARSPRRPRRQAPRAKRLGSMSRSVGVPLWTANSTFNEY